MAGADVLCGDHGVAAGEAEAVLRHHVGVCLDTTHTGVMCEDPADAVRRLHWEGIRTVKVQLGAALSVDVGEGGPPAALRAFADEVYLHQVMVRSPDGQRFFTDLPDALDADPAPAGDWRVHFHVPLSWDGEGAIRTTRDQVDADFLRAALDVGCEHFESEIYTLDVFPNARDSVEAILAQDLARLLERFATTAP
jgi:hypothetical protein